MQFPKILVCLASVGLAGNVLAQSSAEIPDNDVQARARALLHQQQVGGTITNMPAPRPSTPVAKVAPVAPAAPKAPVAPLAPKAPVAPLAPMNAAAPATEMHPAVALPPVVVPKGSSVDEMLRENLHKRMMEDRAREEAEKNAAANAAKAAKEREIAEKKQMEESKKRMQAEKAEAGKAAPAKSATPATSAKSSSGGYPTPVASAKSAPGAPAATASMPAAPVLTPKEAKLARLNEEYKADKITADDYFKRRAEILSEP